MIDLSDLRRIIIQAATGKPAHIPSAFSCLEIIWALYDKVLKPEDVFILSKGHGCLALYAVLEEQGYDVHLSDYGTKLKGHPEAGIPGVLFSTGSLGHGLALGAGYALAKQIQNKPGRVFVLLGDGECQEGSTWETLRIASEQHLNVCILVDCNQTHFDAYLLATMFMHWGKEIATVVEPGHNIETISRLSTYDFPSVIIFETDKGHGCKTLEADPKAWHHRTISREEAEMLIAEVYP